MPARSSTLLSVADARAAVLAEVRGAVPAEPVPLANALGRVLAEDASAPEDVPGFDNSAMDGFAVRAVDTAGATPEAPGELRLVGESRAGTPADVALGPGQAFRISTGAVVPEGADAVVRVEDTSLADATVRVEVEVEPGRDYRRAGDDIRAGDLVIRKGAVLGAAELGVLTSVGVGEPVCARRPRLAVVCTGDELLAPDEPMRPGGVRNSNAHTLPALAALAGAEIVSVERCVDDRDATLAATERALQADIAVFSGGVSVGVHDHVKDAFAALGIEERFWGVALRPGKPTWFGVHASGPMAGGALAFGLPGNPVSAFVTFTLFVRPAIRALTGADVDLDSTEAILATDLPRMANRDQAVRCALELTSDGWLAHPTGPQGSHVLTSMLGVDALAVIEAGPEPGPEPATAGTRVRVQLLRVASGA